LIKVLEKDSKFNTGYYIAAILEPLSQWRSIEAAGKERKLLVQLLAAVEGVLEGIEKVTLHAVFLKWRYRSWKCIVTNGEYTEWAQINFIEE
jgi:hypothetical protein